MRSRRIDRKGKKNEFPNLASLRLCGTILRMRKDPNPSLLFLVRLQRVERLLDELAAQFFFVLQWQLGIAGDMDDAGS